jgi:hypothetical protein
MSEGGLARLRRPDVGARVTAGYRAGKRQEGEPLCPCVLPKAPSFAEAPGVEL